jgi:hypothetical protein
VLGGCAILGNRAEFDALGSDAVVHAIRTDQLGESGRAWVRCAGCPGRTPARPVLPGAALAETPPSGAALPSTAPLVFRGNRAAGRTPGRARRPRTRRRSVALPRSRRCWWRTQLRSIRDGRCRILDLTAPTSEGLPPTSTLFLQENLAADPDGRCLR